MKSKFAEHAGVLGEVWFAGPLNTRGAILTAPMKIHVRHGKIILSQKTRLWFRAVVCLWAMVVLLTPFIIYSELFSPETTRFTCDRGTGACAVDGHTKDVPRLADITRAEMDHKYSRRDGTNWGIRLVTRDGKKYSIEQQRAQKTSVVSDYRATVKAINAYLADPQQQLLQTSFTYRAGLWEVFQSFFYLLFGVATLFVASRIWTVRIYTFEPLNVTIAVRHPFQREKDEISADRISAVDERAVFDHRIVELQVDGGASIVRVVETGPTDMVRAAQLATKLAELLGKPLQRAS